MNAKIKTSTVDMFRNATILFLSRSAWGNKCQGEKGEVDLKGASPEMIGITKKLMVSPELKAIGAFQNKVYLRFNKIVGGFGMPSFFRKGAYLIDNSRVEEVETYLQDALPEHKRLVEAFCAVYQQRIDEAPEKLKGQFDAANYPEISRLPELFKIEWNWLSLTIPENIPATVQKSEEAKLKAQYSEAREEMSKALREAFGEVISHVTERLAVQPGQEPKIFRDGLFDELTGFMESFQTRNFANDKELEKLIGQSRDLLAKTRGSDNGDKARILRVDTSLRQETAENFEKIKTALAESIVRKPTRRIIL